MKFQIGSNKYRYIYSPTQMEVNSAPVYKCRRGTRERSEDVLWLAREKDGRWIAREAHTDSTDPVRQGKNFLQTMIPIDDITNPGHIDWMLFDTCKGTWKYFGNIMTKHIQNGSEPSLHQNQDQSQAFLYLSRILSPRHRPCVRFAANARVPSFPPTRE